MNRDAIVAKTERLILDLERDLKLQHSLSLDLVRFGQRKEAIRYGIIQQGIEGKNEAAREAQLRSRLVDESGYLDLEEKVMDAEERLVEINTSVEIVRWQIKLNIAALGGE